MSSILHVGGEGDRVADARRRRKTIDVVHELVRLTGEALGLELDSGLTHPPLTSRPPRIRSSGEYATLPILGLAIEGRPVEGCREAASDDQSIEARIRGPFLASVFGSFDQSSLGADRFFAESLSFRLRHLGHFGRSLRYGSSPPRSVEVAPSGQHLEKLSVQEGLRRIDAPEDRSIARRHLGSALGRS